ncbi:MAG TPA: P-II family nitrogen regulator [Euryarchaeota archaeon]|nr:nitrogen regulatory protein P-II [archaeon BMS3Bbin15]HDL15177.1 P-II family nitrogen regulator [Euryarchaeota archaeon]
MKMVRAIIRPEKTEDVASSLAAAGFPALTKVDVYGRGKQRGITVDSIHYEELPKTMILIVVEDDDVEKVVSNIQVSALTGHYGDGKIFVSPVDTAYTIRTGNEEL